MNTDTATLQAVLATPMKPEDNDARASSVRDYLLALVERVWVEQEGFSGKRPFGNSGWSYDLIGPLVAVGLVEATLDEDGYVEEVKDERAFDLLILEAIQSMRTSADSSPAEGDHRG